MNSDTNFKAPLSFSTTNVDEAANFLVDNKVEELPTFTESITHAYEPETKRFHITVDNEQLDFTRDAYLEFCGLIGIPGAFADRIPNDLLIQCVDEMLSTSNHKVRFLVRNKNIIVGSRRDNFVSVKPTEFLECASDLISNHAFREANIGDQGTALLFEPLKDSEISPTTGNVQDRFSIGVEFMFGMDFFGRAKSGLVSAYPYSLRHVCINIAGTTPTNPKWQLVETVTRKKNGAYDFYNRLLENYTGERYQAYLNDITERIEKVAGKNLTDFEYDKTYSRLSRLLGKEVSLAIIGIDEEEHEGIMTDIQYKKKKNTFSKEAATELENLDMFELFNSVTAAAKGYNGIDRSRLQAIGGTLL